MDEGMYEKITARMLVGEGASKEFDVKIGLRQGSVLSPLLFITVLDLIDRKTAMKDATGNSDLCRRPGSGGEWQTGATGDIGGSGTGCLPDTGEK